MGSVVLPHLITGWHVDQAIMSEEERLVVIRFGRDWDADCMRQDEVLYSTYHPSRPYHGCGSLLMASRNRRSSEELRCALRVRLGSGAGF